MRNERFDICLMQGKTTMCQFLKISNNNEIVHLFLATSAVLTVIESESLNRTFFPADIDGKGSFLQ